MTTDRSGPIEEQNWPERLQARVLSNAGDRRVHGFSVFGDLANNYSFAEFSAVALLGEAPSTLAVGLLDLAMFCLCLAPIAEPPAHAASLARTCGAAPTSAIATGMIALAEQVRDLVERHAAFISWLADPRGELPLVDGAADPAELRSIRARLPAGVGAVVHRLPLPPLAAGIALLYEAGLQTSDLIAAAIMIARLPLVAAEVLHARPGAVRDYPTNTPLFDYRPRRQTS